MAENGVEPKDINPLKKAMLWSSIKMKTLFNSSRNQVADAYGTVRVGDEMVGPNLLGQFLMELRDTGKLDYTLPADALNFIEHLKE